MQLLWTWHLWTKMTFRSMCIESNWHYPAWIHYISLKCFHILCFRSVLLNFTFEPWHYPCWNTYILEMILLHRHIPKSSLCVLVRVQRERLVWGSDIPNLEIIIFWHLRWCEIKLITYLQTFWDYHCQTSFCYNLWSTVAYNVHKTSTGKTNCSFVWHYCFVNKAPQGDWKEPVAKKPTL